MDPAETLLQMLPDTTLERANHPRQVIRTGQHGSRRKARRGVWMKHGANSISILDSDEPALAAKVFRPGLLPLQRRPECWASATDPVLRKKSCFQAQPGTALVR